MDKILSKCHISIIGINGTTSENTLTLNLRNFESYKQHQFAIYTSSRDEFLVLMSQPRILKVIKPKVSILLGLRKYILRAHISIYNNKQRIHFSGNATIHFE